MAKKFMYVCIGIMALAVTFHVGAEYGKASIVDHSTSGVVALLTGSSGRQVLLDNGELWNFATPEGWNLLVSMGEPVALPLPVSQVKFMGDYQFLVDVNNNGWSRVGPTEWVNYGPPSGGVGAQSTTWGKIKAEWEE